MSDKISFLNLPKTIIIKIIEKDIGRGISLRVSFHHLYFKGDLLQDRKNLRGTCKAMEQIVSECDLQATPFMRMLVMYQVPFEILKQFFYKPILKLTILQ